jgi:hypothetical protein
MFNLIRRTIEAMGAAHIPWTTMNANWKSNVAGFQ